MLLLSTVSTVESRDHNYSDDSSSHSDFEMPDNLDKEMGGGTASAMVSNAHAGGAASSEFLIPQNEATESMVVEGTAVEAELHEEVVVEGAVVTDDKDEPDPKALRCIRIVQSSRRNLGGWNASCCDSTWNRLG